MMHFMDESFWIAVCFVIFVFLAYRPVKKAIINSLDIKIEEIKKTLTEAQKLRDDAKIILDEIQLEMENFEDRKDRIIDSAESSTSKLVETRSKEIHLQINRMRDSATKSIENLKNKASQDLKEEFTDHVMKLVKAYLEESKNNSTTDAQIADHLLGKK